MEWDRSLEDLKDFKIINVDVYKQTKEMMNDIIKKIPNLKPEKLMIFAIHLAYSTQRSKETNNIEEIDESLFNELKDEPNYDRALELCTDIIKKSKVEYTKIEKSYLLIHCCNLFRD